MRALYIIMREGIIPKDWEKSDILNLFLQPFYTCKRKGDALNRGNYRGLKLTEHAMKVMERIMDTIIRERIDIDGED